MSDILRGADFTDGVPDDVTAAKLQNLVDDAVIQTSFATDKPDKTPVGDDVAVFYDTAGTRWVKAAWSAIGALFGTVTSIGVSAPSDLLGVTGSPVTSSGTVALAKVSQTANKFYASPNGSSGVPTFRATTPADTSYGYQLLSGDSASITLDLTAYNSFRILNFTTSVTLVLTNPVAGKTCFLFANTGGSHTLKFPAGTLVATEAFQHQTVILSITHTGGDYRVGYLGTFDNPPLGPFSFGLQVNA